MIAKQADSKLLLSIAEAAEKLSLGRTKTCELILAGEFPIVKVGRAIRIPARALEEWVEKKQLRLGA